ncbi:hypothetical protein ACJJTC_013718 [Scirpophaga incertulas]
MVMMQSTPYMKSFDEYHQRSARMALRTNDELNCEKPSFYFCEEPPNIVSWESTKMCKFRHMRYQEQVYRWVAGRGCLYYTPGFLYVAGYNNINLTAGCFYGSLYAPCLEIAKKDGTCGCYPFDPGLEEMVSAVNEAMIPSARGRWERCFHAASDCCTNYMPGVVNSTLEENCESTFDGWTCWHATEAGTVANAVCTEFAYSNIGPSCHHFSSKECYSNATWEAQTDYSTCSITPRLLRRYRFHIAMLSFSIVSCIPAIIIFFVYKRLRITRVALHRNLLIAIVLRNILVIVTRSEVYIDEITNAGDTVLSGHGVWCRILSVAERIAANGVFTCMLVEGIYLHRLIVAVFRKQLNMKWLYVIGAVIAITPVIAWAVVMAVYNDHSCWLIYQVDHIQWILDAPRVAILLVNTGLFIDVLRVLLTKIRNAENANQLSTAKTTLFLMPIFGSQFLLTAFRPNTTNCTTEQVYYYIAYTVEGIQGFIVSMLYCYVNKEVRMLLKTTYRKTETAVVSRVRRDSNYPRMSVDPRSDRRFTYSTALPSQHDDEPKNNYTAITPKLHVAEIISIQANERLADILEPVYETLDIAEVNEGYDSLDRSSIEYYSAYNATHKNQKVDPYYGFTNVSSESTACHDWIKSVSSPSNTAYYNSLSDYEPNNLYKKYSVPKYPTIKTDDEVNRLSVNHKTNGLDKSLEKDGNSDKSDNNVCEGKSADEANDSNSEDRDMLHEIMNYIQESDNNNVVLSPNALSPNREDDDKIIFVD